MDSPLKTILLSAVLCAHAFAAETVIKDKQGMDCHVYTPDPVVPAKTYQLVVGVHGAGGKGNGAAGMKGWANRGDVRRASLSKRRWNSCRKTHRPI
jgi:predicted peptidase